MRDDHKRKRRRILPMLAILVFVIYPLSTGPVYMLAGKVALYYNSMFPWTVMRIVYAPLIFVAKPVPMLWDLLDRYVYFWCGPWDA